MYVLQGVHRMCVHKHRHTCYTSTAFFVFQFIASKVDEGEILEVEMEERQRMLFSSHVRYTGCPGSCKGISVVLEVRVIV